MVEIIVFAVCAAIVLVGAVGVIAARNPVHSALFLIQTLFGMAVLFISLEAHFLAAVQVVVYAGAIVILFLFVIMLLGVDQAEDLNIEPIVGQRFIAFIVGAATFVLMVATLAGSSDAITGQRQATGPLGDELTDNNNVRELAEALFTDYVFAFEATAILLTIAVVGAVVLAKRTSGEMLPVPQNTLEIREADYQARVDARAAELEANAAAAAEAGEDGSAEASSAAASDDDTADDEMADAEGGDA